MKNGLQAAAAAPRAEFCGCCCCCATGRRGLCSRTRVATSSGSGPTMAHIWLAASVALSLLVLLPFFELAHGLDNGLALTPPQGDPCQCCRLSFTCALTGCVCLAGRVMAAALAGWRSWNSYTCQDSTNTTFTGGDIISDAAMRTAMHAVLDTSRSVQGVSTTLASLGYDYISMDDGWQQCNCSTHQDIDPTLPSCSIGDCRGGRCSWHDKPSGAPMVNKHRFPRYKRTQIFCAILYYKMIILARQARDKHRQNSNGDAFSSVPAA